MKTIEQAEFLLGLGQRLDNWVNPGDAEDIMIADAALYNEQLKQLLPPPVRIADLLMARWMKVKDFAHQTPANLVLNPAQRYFSKERTGQDIILKSGKVGFTTYLSLLGFLRCITSLGRSSCLVAHEKEPAQDYFAAIEYAWRNIPGKLGKELRQGALKPSKKSVRQWIFPELQDSRYFVETAGDAAAGIGQNFQFLHCTEVSRWEGNVKQTFSTLTTHQVGEHQETYIESRPFGDTGYFHDEWQSAKQGASEFRAHFYEWWWNLAHSRKLPSDCELTEEELGVMRRYAAWRAQHPDYPLPKELTPERMAWRRVQYRKIRDLAPQEFAEDAVTCFIGSGNCPFSGFALADIVKRAEQPIEAEIDNSGEENGLLVWERPEPGEDYVAFVDPAGGLWSSRSCMQIFKRSTMRQVAEWVGRDGAAQLAYRADALGRRYNNALLAVETNLGDTTVTLFSKLTEIKYPNLYWRKELDADGKQTEKLGWFTGPKTRPGMFDLLGETLAAHPEYFRSLRLAADIKTHVRNGDRIEPREGCTGDITIAAAGALKVMERGGLKKITPWITHISLADAADEIGGRGYNWQRIN